MHTGVFLKTIRFKKRQYLGSDKRGFYLKNGKK